MNTIEVRLFAGARECIAADFIEITASTPISVGELKKAIVSANALLRPYVEFGRIAIDNDFVDDSIIIESFASRSAIALIPPVSGG